MSAPSPALEALGKQNPDSLLSSTKEIWNELSSSRELLLAETIKAMPNWTKTANVDRFIFLALEALGKQNPDSLLSSTKEIGNELSSSRELLLAETNNIYTARIIIKYQVQAARATTHISLTVHTVYKIHHHSPFLWQHCC